MNHTPGPWSIWSYNPGTHAFVIGPDNGHSVAVVHKTPPEHGPSNARLIAAAPDLLEALEACAESLAGCDEALDQMAGVGGYKPDSAIAQARAAIGKAQGKQEAAQAESPGRSGEEG